MANAKCIRLCMLAVVMNIAAWAADQAFTDLEAYLPKQAAAPNSYSPGKEVERFRSFARLDKAYRFIQGQQFELAKQELLPLVKQSPDNWRACAVYLLVLYRLDEYAPLVRHADLTLKRQPGFIPALLYRSRAYAASGRPREAITGFENLARQPELLAADRISVLETLGDLYIRTKEYRLALVTSTRVLDLQPSFQSRLRRGLALDSLDQPEGAELAYAQSLELARNPSERVQALRGAAESLRKEKKWSAARDTLGKALQIEPEDTSLLRSLAETEYQLQNYREAERQIRHLLSIQQNTGDREFLANILLLRRDWQNAETAFRALLADRADPPRRARAYRALSQIAEAQSNPASSAEYLKRALVMEPSFSGQQQLANLLIAQGKLAEAASLLTELAKKVPIGEDKHGLLLTLGQVMMREKQYLIAATVFTEAAGIKEDAFTLNAASDAEEKAGNLSAAIEFGRKAAVRKPSSEADLRLGTLFEKRGDLAQAVTSFEAAADQASEAAQKAAIYRQIGFAYTRIGDHERALRSFEWNLAQGADDAVLHRAIAETYIHLGRFSEAVGHLRKAIAVDNTLADRRALAMTEEKAGDLDAAVLTYSELLGGLAVPSTEREEVSISLAELEARRGNHARAADWWLQAEAQGGGRPELLASAAESLILAKRWQSAVDLYKRFLTISHLSRQNRAHALETMGFASLTLGSDEAAGGYLQQAIETGAAGATVYQDLGFILYRLGRWGPALDAFSQVPDADAHNLIAVAQCYLKLNKPGLAIHFLEQALEQKQILTRAERRQAYADLGFLYANGQDYRRAIEAWQQAQSLEHSPVLGLGLARLNRLSGDVATAQRELGEIDIKVLSQSQKAEYFDEFAQADAQAGQRKDSLHAWETANQIEPSARRSYEVGLGYLHEGQVPKAIPFLEHAAREPQNRVYIETLAYAYKSAGRLNEAVAGFEQLTGAGPTSNDIYKELGYLEMRLGHNASAERWFRHAIDADSGPQTDRQTAETFGRSREPLREDIARLTNRYDLTVYQGYSDQRFLSTALAPGLGVNSIVPAGSGIELAYQPPRIGFRNERIFQMFVRAIWNNEPGSLAFQSGSGQIGLGIRYKPLASQNLQLSFERLIPLTTGVPQNWILRGMSSWNAGYRIRPGERLWNYSLLFVDAASLLQGPRIAAQFLQVRQGFTVRAGQVLLITPHVVATARHQSPQAAIGTYLEAGGGLSLRFLLPGSTYASGTASFEVVLDCHKGFLIAQPQTPGYAGCRAAGIVRF